MAQQQLNRPDTIPAARQMHGKAVWLRNERWHSAKLLQFMPLSGDNGVAAGLITVSFPMRPYVDPPLPGVIRRIANSADRRLAWEFFVFFSRFEYALKRHDRYLMPGTGPAEPNWDRFASDYADAFDPHVSPELAAAVDHYLSAPPRKQLRDNGKMTWSEPSAYDGLEPLLVWLLRVIRVVRNNLFHGGKFPLVSISDPSRDRDLLAHAIAVLDACLKLDQRVETQFVEDIHE